MRREFHPCVYILASKRLGTLYVGVTSDLVRRLWQHREGVIPGFTKRHRVHILIWFEQHGTVESAIAREKQLKNWHRPWKVNLIEASNPNWADLAVNFGFDPLPATQRRNGC